MVSPPSILKNLAAVPITAISLSSRYCTQRVCFRKAFISEAMKNSFSPVPTISGVPFLTATIRSSPELIATESRSSLYLPGNFLNCVFKTHAAKPFLNHVRQYLCVGVRDKFVAAQKLLEFLIVFYYSVVHYGYLSGAINLGMGVCFCNGTVRAPSGMTYRNSAGTCFYLSCLAYFSYALDDLDV